MEPPKLAGRWRLAVAGSRARLWDGAEEVRLGATEAVALAYLALAGPTARARLAALMWPDAPVARARANLRQLLFRLGRRAEVLAGDPLALHAAVHVQPLGSPGVHPGPGPEPIDELDPDRHTELADWFAAERERRTAAALLEVDRGWRAMAAVGEWEEALAHAQREVAVEPRAEQGYRRMMRAQLELGRVQDALATFERYLRLLRAGLDHAPAPATAALAQRALQDGTATAGAARSLVELAWSEYQRGRTAASEYAASAALAALERFGDSAGVAEACFLLGSIARRRGDVETASAWWSLALHASVEPPDAASALAKHLNEAMVHDGLGAHESARDHYLAALDLAHALGDRRGQAIALNNLAHFALASGRHEAALDLARAAQVLAEALADEPLLAAALEGAARCAIAVGDAVGSRGLAARAYLLARQQADALVLVEATLSLSRASLALGDAEVAGRYAAHASDLARRFECHDATLAAERALARCGNASVTPPAAHSGAKEVDDDQALALP